MYCRHRGFHIIYIQSRGPWVLKGAPQPQFDLIVSAPRATYTTRAIIRLTRLLIPPALSRSALCDQVFLEGRWVGYSS